MNAQQSRSRPSSVLCSPCCVCVVQLSSSFADELNSVSTSFDESCSRLSRMTASSVELTKMLDKLRLEKAQLAKATSSCKQETVAYKSKAEAMEQSMTAQTDSYKKLKAFCDAAQTEGTRIKEELTHMEATNESYRQQRLQAKLEGGELHTKYQQLADEHHRCEMNYKQINDRANARQETHSLHTCIGIASLNRIDSSFTLSLSSVVFSPVCVCSS